MAAWFREIANFNGYAGCAEESQIGGFSVRAGPTQYCSKADYADYSDSGNNAAAGRFRGILPSICRGRLKMGCNLPRHSGGDSTDQ
jgi:hypothetical protein